MAHHSHQHLRGGLVIHTVTHQSMMGIRVFYTLVYQPLVGTPESYMMVHQSLTQSQISSVTVSEPVIVITNLTSITKKHYMEAMYLLTVLMGQSQVYQVFLKGWLAISLSNQCGTKDWKVTCLE